MKEYVVCYQNAVLLKKMGINKKQKRFYDKDEKLKLVEECYLLLEDDKRELLIKNKLYYAPTQSYVQNLLRNKYNVHINPYRYRNKQNLLKYKVKINDKYYENFDTYEGCLETGIYVGLKHLKTLKNLEEKRNQNKLQIKKDFETKKELITEKDIFSKNLIY